MTRRKRTALHDVDVKPAVAVDSRAGPRPPTWTTPGAARRSIGRSHEGNEGRPPRLHRSSSGRTAGSREGRSRPRVVGRGEEIGETRGKHGLPRPGTHRLGIGAFERRSAGHAMNDLSPTPGLHGSTQSLGRPGKLQRMGGAVVTLDQRLVSFAIVVQAGPRDSELLGFILFPVSSASSASRSQAAMSPGVAATRASRQPRSRLASPRRAASQARIDSTSVSEKRETGRCSAARWKPTASFLAFASLNRRDSRLDPRAFSTHRPLASSPPPRTVPSRVPGWLCRARSDRRP